MTLEIKYVPEGSDGVTHVPADPIADREDRNKYLKELYAKLQALFPGIDPKKEPAFPINARAGNPGQPQPGQMQQKGTMGGQGSPGMGQVQRTPQMANMPAPSAAS